MKAIRIVFASALAIVLAAPLALAAGGSRSSTSTPTETPKSPEQIAMDHYNNGLTYRDKAWKLEKKLPELTEGKERDKTLKKISRSYENAIREFSSAISNNPTMYQAYSSLGYAYRKTGQFDNSLEAYDRALSIEPNYTEAIEYRAEAYLGLNRVEEAMEAYEQLEGKSNEHAGQLLEAMQKWLEARRTDSDGVSAQTLNQFEQWLEQKASTAGDTVGHNLPRRTTW